MRSWIPTLGAVAALALPAVVGAAEGVRYGGSSTINDTVLQGGAIQAFEARTGTKVTVVDVAGTRRGLQSLAEGRINLAGSGRTLRPEERKAGLIGVIIGYDALAVYVNGSNPVRGLTRGELKAILTGEATRWRRFGGKDVEINVLVEPVASGRATVQMIQEQVMHGAAFGGSFREVDQLADQVREVARSEGAICIASVGFLGTADPALKGRVRAIALDGTEPTDANIRSGAYPLSRPLLLATRGLPTGDVKAFVDFMLSREGQAIVERSFVAVKK